MIIISNQQSIDIPSVSRQNFKKMFIMGYDLPGSGSSSLHGRASGVMECWYTKAARLPTIQKYYCRELVNNVKNPPINFWK